MKDLFIQSRYIKVSDPIFTLFTFGYTLDVTYIFKGINKLKMPFTYLR